MHDARGSGALAVGLVLLSLLGCDDAPPARGAEREDDRDTETQEVQREQADAARPNGARDGGRDTPLGSARDAAPGRDEPARPLDAGTIVDARAPERDAGDAALAEPRMPSRFPSVTDPTAAGPYKAKTIMATGPKENYTIYHPDPLGAEGLKHPVLTWGNGGGTQPGLYPMLPHLATHGFVVVAANTIPSPGAEAQLGQDMLAGIEWILAENERQGSVYYGKLDATRLAPFGYSMGGLGTFTIAGDARWTTTVHISGGNMGATVSRIAMLRGPSFFLCGENDIANPNCEADFNAVTTQAVLYAVMKGEDHLGILFGEWATRIRGTVTAWMRHRLMDDASSAALFEGPECGLCKDANYVVKKKNFD